MYADLVLQATTVAFDRLQMDIEANIAVSQTWRKSQLLSWSIFFFEISGCWFWWWNTRLRICERVLSEICV